MKIQGENPINHIKRGEGENSVLTKNTLYNFVGQVIPLVIGFVSIPFIMRGFGKERFGILALLWGIMTYFSICDFGFGRALIKFVSEKLGREEYEEIPEIVWTSLFFNLVFSSVLGLTLFFLVPFLVEASFNIPVQQQMEAQAAFSILALSLPIMTITSTLRGILEGCQRFDMVNVIKIPSNSLIFLIPLFSALFELRLPFVVIAYVVSRLITALAYMMLSFKVMPYIKTKISVKAKVLLSIFKFGGWVTISSIIGPIMVYLDRFLIGSLLTMEAVSYYTAPGDMISRFLILPTSIVLTIFPVFSSMKADQNEKWGKLFTKSVKYLILVMGFLMLASASFAKEILFVWLGGDFAQKSTLLFQILAVGVFINSLSYVPFNLLQGRGRPDIPAKIHLIELPLYLVLAWFLILKFGINGAALAWTIRVGFDAFLLFGFSKKIVPEISSVQTKRDKTILASIFSALVLLSLLIVFFVHVFWLKLIFLFPLFSIFWKVVWKYCLDDIDKKLFLSVFLMYKKGYEKEK